MQVLEDGGEDDGVVRRLRQGGVVEGGGLDVEPTLRTGDLGAAGGGLDAAHAPAVLAQRLEQLSAATADVEQAAAAGTQPGEPSGDLTELAPPPGVFEALRGAAGATGGVVVVGVVVADLRGRRPRVEVDEAAASAADESERIGLPAALVPMTVGRLVGHGGGSPQPIAADAHDVGAVTSAQHTGDRLHRKQPRSLGRSRQYYPVARHACVALCHTVPRHVAV